MSFLKMPLSFIKKAHFPWHLQPTDGSGWRGT
jgi:hypothetical protein